MYNPGKPVLKYIGKILDFALEVVIESMELRFENRCENENSVCSRFNLIFTTVWFFFSYLGTFYLE